MPDFFPPKICLKVNHKYLLFKSLQIFYSVLCSFVDSFKSFLSVWLSLQTLHTWIKAGYSIFPGKSFQALSDWITAISSSLYQCHERHIWVLAQPLKDSQWTEATLAFPSVKITSETVDHWALGHNLDEGPSCWASLFGCGANSRKNLRVSTIFLFHK